MREASTIIAATPIRNSRICAPSYPRTKRADASNTMKIHRLYNTSRMHQPKKMNVMPDVNPRYATISSGDRPSFKAKSTVIAAIIAIRERKIRLSGTEEFFSLKVDARNILVDYNSLCAVNSSYSNSTSTVSQTQVILNSRGAIVPVSAGDFARRFDAPSRSKQLTVF